MPCYITGDRLPSTLVAVPVTWLAASEARKQDDAAATLGGRPQDGKGAFARSTGRRQAACGQRFRPSRPDGVERLREVRDQVVRVLDPDGEAD